MIQYKGTPRTGSRISVGLDGPLDPQASYHWVQIDGPPVIIEDETKPKIQLTVPAEAQSLTFLLTKTDARGQQTYRVTIPIQPPASPSSPATQMPRADGGDDQIGLVGRRITLNGSRSWPPAGIVYRWIQLGGPRVEPGVQENAYFSFTPKLAGVYRFGLVVALASSGSPGGVSISDVDEVVVTVGDLPPGPGPLPLGGGAGSPWTAALDQVMQGPGSSSARGTLEQAAGVFDSIAWRAALYTNFAELTSELTRRLEAIIPADPTWRQFWTLSVFAPMTQQLVAEMLGVGLDLRTPQGQQQGLNPLQQDRLEKLFSSYAREFRSRAQAR
jgi:hypothetical protein